MSATQQATRTSEVNPWDHTIELDMLTIPHHLNDLVSLTRNLVVGVKVCEALNHSVLIQLDDKDNITFYAIPHTIEVPV